MTKHSVKQQVITCLFTLLLFAVLLTPISVVAGSVNINLPAMVCIDNPTLNSSVNDGNSQLNVKGWSLSVYGVSKVQIYVDNVYKADAVIGGYRPDVDKALPGYSGGVNSGYSGSVDLSNIAYGTHTITVKSAGNDGNIAEISTVIYKIPSTGKNQSSMICIDTPKLNSYVASLNNQLSVIGWSLNGYGVQKVQLYLDDVYKSDAVIGGLRPDVDKAVPGYFGGTSSGFNGTIDISSVQDGVHKVTVKSIGNDGTIKELSTTIKKVSSKSNIPLVCIDYPNKYTQTNENKIDVSGWSLNAYGVSKVQIYVDNVYKVDAVTGGYRPDVDKALPGYSGAANSGYSGSVDLSNIAYGTHTITVKSTGNDGNIAEISTVIYKIPSTGKNQSSMICIDTPKLNSYVASLNNQLSVIGWSLNGYGVQKVQLYLDDVYKSDAVIGGLRPDVDKAVPGYFGGASSGFNGTIDISSVVDGVHKVTVKSIGNDGTIKELSTTVRIVSKNNNLSLVCIDSPKYTQTNGNKIDVSGWSLNVYGISKVQIYVDNVYKADAVTGGYRPDVDKALPGYSGGINSGYSGSADITGLSIGIHKVTVKSIGNDGSVVSTDASIFKVSNGVDSMPNMMCVDTPSNNTFIRDNAGQITVVGWSLAAFGVGKVELYIDNSYVGDAITGISRPDVDRALPNYTNGCNSGFSYNFNISLISDGVHTLSVRSLGNDGQTIYQDLRIYKFSGSNKFITSYNISLQDMVTKQMNDGEAVADQNGTWVSANRNDVQYYVDPFNFMDSYGVYQFLRLDYIQGITADDLNKILNGKGVLSGKGAQFLDAASNANINPIYLVAHALLETGNGTSALANGISVNGVNVYNLFGINAFDKNPNYFGSQYAFAQGWTSIDNAIYGGAKWISGTYINNSTYKQNTLYKMRWNPDSPANHQYATDIRWAYNQVYNIKKLMDMCVNPILQFNIPQYK